MQINVSKWVSGLDKEAVVHVIPMDIIVQPYTGTLAGRDGLAIQALGLALERRFYRNKTLSYEGSTDSIKETTAALNKVIDLLFNHFKKNEENFIPIPCATRESLRKLPEAIHQSISDIEVELAHVMQEIVKPTVAKELLGWKSKLSADKIFFSELLSFAQDLTQGIITVPVANKSYAPSL